MSKEKWIPLKPLTVTEREVGSLAWDRTVKKHQRAFVLLSLLMLAVMTVWLLPIEMNSTLHSLLFIIAFIGWLSGMYNFFKPKYQRLKKELLNEWENKVGG